MLDFQNAIDALNHAYKSDPCAIRALLINVVPCNEELANHDTIQCRTLENGYSVSALGFLNGVLGALELPLIASKWSDIPNPDGSYDLLGFCEYIKS